MNWACVMMRRAERQWTYIIHPPVKVRDGRTLLLKVSNQWQQFLWAVFVNSMLTLGAVQQAVFSPHPTLHKALP